MKLKQVIGVFLLAGMAISLWYKLEDSLHDVEEPLAMGALILVIVMILVVLIVRITRS